MLVFQSEVLLKLKAVPRFQGDDFLLINPPVDPMYS